MARSVVLVVAASALLLAPQAWGDEDKPAEASPAQAVAPEVAAERPATDDDSGQGGGASPEATAHAEEVFTQLDANEDGQISADDVPDEHRRLFRRLLRTSDRDDNEQLSREELVAGLAGVESGEGEPADRDDAEPRRRRRPGDETNRPEGSPFERFRRLDSNGDGLVVLDEVPDGARPFFDRMLERLDKDGDKALSTDELKAGAEAFARRDRGPAGRPPEGVPGGRPGYPGFDRPGGPMPMGLFGLFDANRNGSLDAAEIDGAASALRKLDADGDGAVSFAELREIGPPGPPRPRDNPRPESPSPEAPRPDAPSPEAPREAAAETSPGLDALVSRALALDTSGDGKLSADEAPERLKRRFDRIDANSDGVLDEPELRATLVSAVEKFGSQPDRFFGAKKKKADAKKAKKKKKPAESTESTDARAAADVLAISFSRLADDDAAAADGDDDGDDDDGDDDDEGDKKKKKKEGDKKKSKKGRDHKKRDRAPGHH
ncbi:MAG: hypothetical protein AB7U73_25250, partial [Pirellulales bacterium]